MTMNSNGTFDVWLQYRSRPGDNWGPTPGTYVERDSRADAVEWLDELNESEGRKGTGQFRYAPQPIKMNDIEAGVVVVIDDPDGTIFGWLDEGCLDGKTRVFKWDPDEDTCYINLGDNRLYRFSIDEDDHGFAIGLKHKF